MSWAEALQKVVDEDAPPEPREDGWMLFVEVKAAMHKEMGIVGDNKTRKAIRQMVEQGVAEVKKLQTPNIHGNLVYKPHYRLRKK